MSSGDIVVDKDRLGQLLATSPSAPCQSTLDDLTFLAAWDKGVAPWPSSVLRIRQLYWANPALARAARPLSRLGF
jgi:hypothetical protein